MGDAITPPIFVLATDGLHVFASEGEATSSVESVDVEDGEYSAVFDASGRELRFVVDNPTKRSRLLFLEMIELTPVRIVACEPNPSRADDLRDLLAPELGRSKTTPLSELVEEAARKLK